MCTYLYDEQYDGLKSLRWRIIKKDEADSSEALFNSSGTTRHFITEDNQSSYLTEGGLWP
jgi:hypothetical protein